MSLKGEGSSWYVFLFCNSSIKKSHLPVIATDSKTKASHSYVLLALRVMRRSWSLVNYRYLVPRDHFNLILNCFAQLQSIVKDSHTISPSGIIFEIKKWFQTSWYPNSFSKLGHIGRFLEKFRYRVITPILLYFRPLSSMCSKQLTIVAKFSSGGTSVHIIIAVWRANN